MPVRHRSLRVSQNWSRVPPALGHTVRLMPPAYVKPYVKRQKNDATDAEAICEAVTRANMRFVPTKTPEQQSCLMLHRTRHPFIRQQTAVINSIRAPLPRLGIVAPVGPKGSGTCACRCRPERGREPEVARAIAPPRHSTARSLKQIVEFARLIFAWSTSTKRASAFIIFLGSVRYWRRLWPRASLTRRSSDQGATSRLGSGSYRSSTRVVARTGSAVSANKVTGIYAACSWPAHSRSSATPRSTAPSIGPGSRRCWRGGRPRSLPSRSPISSPEWPGR